jgi:hypothetical protein
MGASATFAPNSTTNQIFVKDVSTASIVIPNATIAICAIIAALVALAKDNAKNVSAVKIGNASVIVKIERLIIPCFLKT